MSDNDQDADFPIEDSEPPKIEMKKEKPPKKRGGGVAWLAFLFSIVAIAMVGYRWFQDWRAPEDTSQLDTMADISELRDDLRATNDSIGSLGSRIDSIPRTDYSGDIAAVEQSVEEQLQLLNTLPSRMSTLENSVASLAGISQGAHERPSCSRKPSTTCRSPMHSCNSRTIRRWQRWLCAWRTNGLPNWLILR